MLQNETSLLTYSSEEEKRIIRNTDGVPVGIRPDNRWTPARIVTWLAITTLGILGWWMLAIVHGEHVNTIWFVITAVCIYAIGYRFYALYIQRCIMRPDDTNATPAERINDGRDLNPIHRVVLYGHHFAVTAGADLPIGPILAAQMGYLPGTLWTIIGVLAVGAVQDMLVLLFLMRRGGRSLGQMATDEIGRTGGIMMTIVVFVTLMIVPAVLAMVRTNALAVSSWGIFLVGMIVPIAIGMGLWLRSVQPGKITQVSFVDFGLLIAVIIDGRQVTESPLGHYLHLSLKTLVWATIIYGFLTAVLPVWILLTPYDHLSTFMKAGTITVLALGIIIVRPLAEMSAVTEFVLNAAGPVFAGTLLPFLFITIACGALSGIHAMVSSGTSPKMVEKETQVRMIGYGGIFMESFVAIMVSAVVVSLNPGIYFPMNTSTTTMNKFAGPETVAATPRKTTDDPGHHCEKLAEVAVGNLSVTDAQGRRPVPKWGFWDDNGNSKIHTGTEAPERLASDVGEPSVVPCTGGAPTLSVGIAHILHQIGGGRAMMGFWYHFAIIFEALLILSVVDAVTRVTRFQSSDALGNALSKLRDPSWHVGVWGITAAVVASQGALLFTGVTDLRGGIQTFYPPSGIVNQLITAVALLVVTIMAMREGYTRWVWIPAVPPVFDTVAIFTASRQKIFPSNSLVGYSQQHHEAVAKLGTLTDPVKIEETRVIARNMMIQGMLSIIFPVMVAFVMVCALIRIVQMLRNRDTTTPEDPYQESNFYAPEMMIAPSPIKRVSREYKQVGDPAPIPHKAYVEKS